MNQQSCKRAIEAGFSIVIPTWNNVEFLKLCIESIKANSAYPHEIIIHINDGSDGTLDWVREMGFVYTHSTDNIGVPLSVNLAVSQATRQWVLFLNDDMWVCPGWDEALVNEIDKAGTDRIFLCSRLIEPTRATGDKRVMVMDCGTEPDNFDRQKLLANYMAPGLGDERFVFSQPTLVLRSLWHAVGGYSIEFSPGLASDDDLIMKLWLVGCREFRLVDSSRVYHFACRSTGRIRKNRGGRGFLLKWGIRWKYFRDVCAAIPNGGKVPRLSRYRWRDRLRRAFYSLVGGQPLPDIDAWKPDLTCDWTIHSDHLDKQDSAAAKETP